MEWYLLHGERGVPPDEMELMSANDLGDNEWNTYIIDTTPQNSYEDTLWALSPAALELIKNEP